MIEITHCSSSNNNVKTDAKIRKNTLAVCNNDHDNNTSSQAERNPLFDQKLDIATEGLEPYYLEPIPKMADRHIA